jgi:hypothetical protein
MTYVSVERIKSDRTTMNLYISWGFCPANVAITASVFLQAQLYFHLQSSFQFFFQPGLLRDNESEGE